MDDEQSVRIIIFFLVVIVALAMCVVRSWRPRSSYLGLRLK